MRAPVSYRPSDGLRLFGHPAHAVLVHLPLGLWTASAAWDALAVLGVGPGAGALFFQVAFWSIVGGLVVAALAVVTGFLDFLAIDEGHKGAADLATYHLMTMLSAAAAYGGSVLARGGPTPAEGARLAWALGLAGAGLLLLTVGGWMGAELVYRHGVGSAASRHPNPSSPGHGSSS
jgi:uncharacterized membrane protein